MTIVRHAIREHDVVELLEAAKRTERGGEWPAGTIGTIVSDYGEVKLVEIAEEQPPGAMLDLIQVPEVGLKLVGKYSD